MLRPYFEFLSNQPTQFAGLDRREIALLGLGVGVDHVEDAFGWRTVVDDTPRLPEPGVAQRTFRSPPEPVMTGPCSGRSISAI